MNPRCQIVIPARLASTRLPEKLLRRAAGKTILQHTFESASRSTVCDEVVVAVDDQKLADDVERFGGKWMMTSRQCASGTDRIAEVAAAMPEADIFINVQGDEPEIDPDVIDRVATALIKDPDADMSTAGTPIRDLATLADPSCVKIVMATGAGQGRAVYFSRAAVPHARDGADGPILAAEPPIFWHHIGLYAYRRDFLRWFAGEAESLLEKVERLEQLRAVEGGKRILVTPIASATPGIDTQEDLDAFIRRLGAGPV
jgi:3-deoxy-manno-octulosonate cytidylyltransferase (CMP-KDO synthetase)